MVRNQKVCQNMKKKSKINNVEIGSGIGINELIDRIEIIFELVVGVLKVIFVPDFDD